MALISKQDKFYVNSKLQNIFHWSFKMIVLFLYIPFFAVQCFFNYSNIVQGNAANFQVHNKNATQNKQFVLASLEKKSPGKQVFSNLNKRFEPTTAPTCPNISFEIPCSFIATRVFANYTNSFYPHQHQYEGTLRGPPVVA